MSEKFASLLAACTVTIAGLAAAAPAVAQQRPITILAPADDVTVRYVSYRDLNLAKAEDERKLVKRVRHTATDVCVESMPTGLDSEFTFMNCRLTAWRGAAPQIERAVTRAREIAANGWSAIGPVAIAIDLR